MNAHGKMKQFAAEQGRTLQSLRVLAPANDPFFIGTPGHYRQAEWFLNYWRKFGYDAAHLKVHLRRIHYRIVSLEPHERIMPESAPGKPKRKSNIYQNTDNDWQYLITASKYARYLDLVDPEQIIDQRSPEPGEYSKQYIPKQPSVNIEKPSWDMPRIDTDLTWDLDWQMPEATVEGYDYDESLQPYHVEVWIEKSTMEDILVPLCQRYRVGLVTGVGFNSITAIIRLVRERLAKDSRPCRILYISDFDPAGRGMPLSTSRQIEFWLKRYKLNHDVRVNHLMLTQEQVEQYQLPRIPVKGSDKRGANFEQRNGEGQVELDALEALRPGEFESVVKDAIFQFRDAKLADEIRAAKKEASDAVAEVWEGRIEPYREDLEEVRGEVEAIAEQYQEKLTKLADEMEEELQPLRKRREDVLQAIERETEEAKGETDLPEIPEPEVEPDDEHWLFDSGRDYLKQLEYYNVHKNGEDEPPGDDEEDEAA